MINSVLGEAPARSELDSKQKQSLLIKFFTVIQLREVQRMMQINTVLHDSTHWFPVNYLGQYKTQFTVTLPFLNAPLVYFIIIPQSCAQCGYECCWNPCHDAAQHTLQEGSFSLSLLLIPVFTLEVTLCICFTGTTYVFNSVKHHIKAVPWLFELVRLISPLFLLPSLSLDNLLLQYLSCCMDG